MCLIYSLSRQGSIRHQMWLELPRIQHFWLSKVKTGGSVRLLAVEQISGRTLRLELIGLARRLTLDSFCAVTKVIARTRLYIFFHCLGDVGKGRSHVRLFLPVLTQVLEIKLVRTSVDWTSTSRQLSFRRRYDMIIFMEFP